MKLNRRQLLVAGSAFAALATSRPAQASFTDLSARVADIQLLSEEYGPTRIWGFDGLAPGPEIRVKQNARVQRRLLNELPAETSIHWHGIRINNAMDGVPGMTQAAVAPGASFDYDFRAPDAGTYWYHSHSRSFEQVARGLHGALIIEEPDPLDVDGEEVLILDDWWLDPDTAQLVEPFDAMHDMSHAGRLGNFVTTNGAYNYARPVRRHDRLRLRLINASNARIFQLSTKGMDAWTVALDGMPLAQPKKIDGDFFVAPAQRMDLIVDITSETGEAAHLVHVGRNDTFSQAAFDVTGEGTRTQRPEPGALPPNPYTRPNLAAARNLDLRMEGGAMGGMQGAMMNGQMSSMRDMVQSGKFWAFNGHVGGMDGTPLAALSRGETAKIRIVNDTAFPHAMHLHGMHFHEITPDGRLGPVRDTTLVNRGETRDIAFVADNPGKWLLHCHMLSHAASGMMTWIEVA